MMGIDDELEDELRPAQVHSSDGSVTGHVGELLKTDVEAKKSLDLSSLTKAPGVTALTAQYRPVTSGL